MLLNHLFQLFNMFLRNISLAHFPQSSCYKHGQLVVKRQLLWRHMLKQNTPSVLDVNLPVAAISQKHHIHWHLSRQSQHILSQCARRKNLYLTKKFKKFSNQNPIRPIGPITSLEDEIEQLVCSIESSSTDIAPTLLCGAWAKPFN